MQVMVWLHENKHKDIKQLTHSSQEVEDDCRHEGEQTGCRHKGSHTGGSIMEWTAASSCLLYIRPFTGTVSACSAVNLSTGGTCNLVVWLFYTNFTHTKNSTPCDGSTWLRHQSAYKAFRTIYSNWTWTNPKHSNLRHQHMHDHTGSVTSTGNGYKYTCNFEIPISYEYS